MTTKTPEFTLSIKSSLQKFGGFIKVIALVLSIGGFSVGGSYLTNKVNPSNSIYQAKQDSIIHELQLNLEDHEKKIDNLTYRVNTIDQNNSEIKLKLLSIETDIKTLLFYAGQSSKKIK